jgi:hypothetical protein
MGNIADPRLNSLLVEASMRGFRSSFNSFRRETPHTLEGPGVALHHGDTRPLKVSRAQPSATAFRSRLGATGLRQRYQLVPVMLEFVVADRHPLRSKRRSIESAMIVIIQ